MFRKAPFTPLFALHRLCDALVLWNNMGTWVTHLRLAVPIHVSSVRGAGEHSRESLLTFLTESGRMVYICPGLQDAAYAKPFIEYTTDHRRRRLATPSHSRVVKMPGGWKTKSSPFLGQASDILILFAPPWPLFCWLCCRRHLPSRTPLTATSLCWHLHRWRGSFAGLRALLLWRNRTDSIDDRRNGWCALRRNSPPGPEAVRASFVCSWAQGMAERGRHRREAGRGACRE